MLQESQFVRNRRQVYRDKTWALKTLGVKHRNKHPESVAHVQIALFGLETWEQ
jgi:hypothetical protein